MAPKTPKAPSDRPYGLNDNEVNVALHACKLLAEDGKVRKQVDIINTYLHPFLSRRHRPNTA